MTSSMKKSGFFHTDLINNNKKGLEYYSTKNSESNKITIAFISKKKIAICRLMDRRPEK